MNEETVMRTLPDVLMRDVHQREQNGQLILTVVPVLYFIIFTFYGERPMDWKHEESDYSSVENVTCGRKNSLVKTTSNVSLSGIFDCNVCSQGVQVDGCKESRSFTSAFERLELETEIDAKNDHLQTRRTSDAQTESYDDDVEDEITSLRNEGALYRHPADQHSDLLTFQGRKYSSSDIARYWKKDSRMWLWKSTRGVKKKQNRTEETE